MRSSRRGRAGYTIGEMIGVVVIAGLLLAAVVPGLAQALRVRQAEAVLKNDLRNAAFLSEQAYLADRSYPTLSLLRARGFHPSPQVAVDSHAVNGERVYLRLRHQPTGQLCVLDYSRSSAVARNRPDCFAGGQERDTALTMTAELPPAPPSDTFGIRPPPETPTEENPLELAHPSVDSPPDQRGRPGASLSQTFTVTNRSSVTRSFRLGVASSDPATVPNPSGVPERLTLLPNVPAQVRVDYAIAGTALANASAVIPLQVVDDEDERWSGTGSFTVTSDLEFVAPRVELAGATERAVDAGEPIDVTWSVTNRTNAARMLQVSISGAQPAHVEIVSVTGAGRLPFGAGQVRTVTARLRLADGSDGGTRSTLTLEAADAEADGYRGSATLSVETRTILAPPSISPPGSRSALPGETFTLVWTIQNESNATRTFSVSPSVADGGHLEVVRATGTGTQPIARGRSIAASVTYRVRPGTIAGRGSDVLLDVFDERAPEHRATETATVVTSTLMADPAISPPAAQSAKPGAEFTVTWTVRNATNAPRLLSVDAALPAGGELDLASVAGAGDVMFEAFESRVVTARYRVRSASPAGASGVAPLAVTDRAAPVHGARATFAFTTALALESPAWVSVPTSPMFWDEGEERALGYTFRNQSNAFRTFCLEITSAEPGSLAPAAPASACGIRVGPGDTIRVTQRMHAASVGNAVRVAALVYDQDEPPYHAEAAFFNSIRATRPRAVWEAPAPVFLRKWATFDGSRSSSPVASPIVRYVWTWGLVMQQWDPAQGRFVYSSEWGTARDEVTTPAVERAYDYLGSFQVCLTVVDAENRSSDPNCQVVSTIRPTVARLAWRYRGWWTDQDWCLDVWWDNQCDREHGNARWEVDLRPSVGDVAISQAYAVFSVRLHNTDDPDRPAQVNYTGNAGTTPAWGTYSFSRDQPAAVGRAQDGRWRVLTTAGTTAYGWPTGPGIADHPLVLNINLADATGVFDGGPHWVPDDVWITLYVEDASGRWTSSSAYRNHDKGEWRRGYDTALVAEAGPTATVSVERGEDGWYRATGSANSNAGRIVETWWEITSEHALNGSEPQLQVVRRPEVEVQPGRCERITLTFVAKDDRGAEGRATELVMREDGPLCPDIGVASSLFREH